MLVKQKLTMVAWSNGELCDPAVGQVVIVIAYAYMSCIDELYKKHRSAEDDKGREKNEYERIDQNG